jgi:hypothetical protein
MLHQEVNGYVSAYLGNPELTPCLNHTRKTKLRQRERVRPDRGRAQPVRQPAEAAACPRVQD